MRIGLFSLLLLLGCEQANNEGRLTVPPGFECTGKVTKQTPATTEATFQATVNELGTEVPVNGVKVTMCAKNDLACASPIATGTSANGTVSFTVPLGTAGFEGYGRIEAPGYVPKINIANPPPTAAPSTPFKVVMVPQADLDAVLALSGTTLDPERGHLAIRVVDCNGQTAKDVSLSVSNADTYSKPVYVSLMKALTGTQSTDDSGRVLYLNVPPGVVTVQSVFANGNKGSSIEVVVQKGFFTGSVLPPQ